MRILLLSCNTGEGHNSTAKAIGEVLARRGVEYDIVDVLGSCISPSFSRLICNVHAKIYKYVPKLWDVGYRVSDKKQLTQDQEDFQMLFELLRSSGKKLEKMILDGGYDRVVCVHVFSGLMMTAVRKRGTVNVPCYFVATDYTCSPLVDQCDADGFFIPAADLAREFVADGVDSGRLLPYGIPVKQDFYTRRTRQEARCKLGLPEKGMVVLMMCGSMGCGPIRKLALKLSQRLEGEALVVAVCGRNEKLYEELTAEEMPSLRVLGYCSEIPDYMDAADMVVTKPGGLSATEAAVRHVPMVFINAVGGCESRNFTYFLSHGYALGSDESREAADLVVDLANCPEHMERMRQVLEKDFSFNSAEMIADRLLRQE